MHHRGRRAEGGGEAAFCPFRRDTPPLHIVSDGVYDRFVFMRVGVSGVLFFCQFALKNEFIPKQWGRPPRLLPLPVAVFRPFRRDTPAQKFMGKEGYTWLGLFQGMGLPGASKRRTIEK